MKDKAALGCQATFGKTRRIRRTQTYKRTVFADRNRRLVGALAVEQTAVAWFIMASLENFAVGWDQAAIAESSTSCPSSLSLRTW
jgi:hypothetical protein